ncbi:MAG: calcium-binding protein [Bacteroidota bacterium]
MKLSIDAIEEIISNQIEIDCYYDEEINTGWYYFLSEGLSFPFWAEYLQKRRKGENQWIGVEVIGIHSQIESFNGKSFYVEIDVNDMLIPVRLSELRNLQVGEKEEEILQVWRYRIRGEEL